MTSSFKPDFSGLPEILKERVQRDWQSWRESGGAPALPESVLAELPRVWACSPFVAGACLREPALLPSLLDTGGRVGAFDAEAAARLRSQVAVAADEAALRRVLRECRRRELVRIAWRDLSGADALDQTLLALSVLADSLIIAALRWLHSLLSERYGAPQAADGKPLELVVLGMGKLGGGELNFSSDIDLIFCYEQQGETTGARRTSHEEYFETLARKLVQALSDRTEDGAVYRVDTLLRPFGSAGPLAMSFNAMEQYYQTHGREWERYALIKARPIGEDSAAGGRLLTLLKPFVYRRYLDYGAYESLRHMKALIHQEAMRKGSAEDIKLGPGGIREIEFIAQLFQLIRGGRERRLQRCELRPVLRRLGELKLLPEKAAAGLDAAYVFLRRLENRMQTWRDEQTHRLPHDAEAQAALALAMDQPDWPALAREIAARRRAVEAEFERVFAAPHAAGEDERSVRLAALWQDELAADAGGALLAELGFAEPERSLATLAALRGRLRYRSAGELGRQRLAQVMPLMLAAAARAAQPDLVLERVSEILVAIAGRSAYLALLLEHPAAISQLIRLCGASPWIAEQLALHPQLLDTLLDPRLLYAPPRRAELQTELDEGFEHAAADDTEQHMELLRRFKHTQVLRVAAADVSGSVPLMVVSDHLTEIAEVILARTLDIAGRQLVARHGHPRLREQAREREAGFIVVAYGKLGGLELGYGSDLDLVFLHEGAAEDLTKGAKPVEQGQFFARLAQRMVHLLTTATGAGQVYEVDLELRPSGRSGLLVTSLPAFEQYQRAQAWTWEHQALVRARAVAGPAALRAQFEALRLRLLTQPRDAGKLRSEVLDMRARMHQHRDRASPGEFDLKQGEGGITDIEFMVQYCALRWAEAHPALVRYSDNIRILEALRNSGAGLAQDADALADLYRRYRKRVHQLDLQRRPARVADAEFAAQRDFVRDCWRRLFEL